MCYTMQGERERSHYIAFWIIYLTIQNQSIYLCNLTGACFEEFKEIYTLPHRYSNYSSRRRSSGKNGNFFLPTLNFYFEIYLFH